MFASDYRNVVKLGYDKKEHQITDTLIKSNGCVQLAATRTQKLDRAQNKRKARALDAATPIKYKSHQVFVANIRTNLLLTSKPECATQTSENREVLPKEITHQNG